MAIEFTKEQQMAIDSRGCSLIVSAAAGSGKTAVLVQRVIGRICDPSDPCGVDELLVVTFTNAAASEMREKISKALVQQILEHPTDQRLRRQLSLLPAAKIQTVHSFCLDLVREHFALCGVPADFGIADTARTEELRTQALEEILEELYAAGDQDFLALCAALAEEKGDRLLGEVIQEIYDRLISHPDPIKTLHSFTSEEGQQRWKEILLQEAAAVLHDAAADLSAAAEQLGEYPVLKEKYGPAYESCAVYAQAALAATEQGWNAACDCIYGFSNPKMAAVRGFEDKEIMDYFKGVKNTFADRVAQLKTDIFIVRDDTQAADPRNQQALFGLCKAVACYMERYQTLKLRRNLLDFSDLEHYALRLLRTDDGSPSDLALELSRSFKEVLVDEYQDTNDIQDTIFSLLTTQAGGCFYVGDVKQSIYRFRMAKPEIFMDKYRSWKPLEDGMRGEKARLSLNRNFRSRAGVLEVCNHVFRACMSRAFGDVDYTEAEALHPGAPYTGEVKAHLAIIDMAGTTDSEDEDSPAKVEAEAVYVANAIQDMLQTEVVTDPFTGAQRPAEPSDFAVLLSSFANKSGYFIRELERLGIPANGGKKDFWHSMEILVMVSFLRVLDNRRQDIPLIGLLRSPLFFFTSDDLAAIRCMDKQATYFDALQEYAANGSEKAGEFCRMIDRYVSYVPDMSASDLIRMIYSERSVQAVFGAMDGGDERRENLRRFYDLALGFEGGGHRSLFDFIVYIDHLMEKEEDIGSEQGDGVRIMSIHKSKGLEFPFVFLPDLNKTFNFDDARRPVVIHDRLGIGMRIRVPEQHIEYRTPMHVAIAAATRRELASEEMRKLYVAMTRAREKLILVAGVRNYEKLMQGLQNDLRGRGINPGWLSQKSNVAAWLLAAFMTPCDALTREIAPAETIVRRARRRGQEAENRQNTADPALLAMLARADEPYAALDAARLPSKLTPQGTRRLVEEDSAMLVQRHDRAEVDYYPRERSALTAAQKGSAIHLFLQKADLPACASAEGVEQQLHELTFEGILDEEQAAAVDPEWILRFVESPWGRRMQTAEDVLQEYEFAALVTPKELGLADREDEQILMNGIIDLLLIESEGITVLDFKSDRIRPGDEPQAVMRHKLQVDIYASAAEKIFERPIREKIVFFLRTGMGQPV